MSSPSERSAFYNLIARQVLDRIPVEDVTTRVHLIIDRRKSKRENAEFNSYIPRQLQGRLDPRVPLDVYHHRSTENLGLQAADLFAWGTFRKHERNERAVQVWCPPAWSTYGWEHRRDLQRTYRSSQ